jgi:hypothetical protein
MSKVPNGSSPVYESRLRVPAEKFMRRIFGSPSATDHVSFTLLAVVLRHKHGRQLVKDADMFDSKAGTDESKTRHV